MPMDQHVRQQGRTRTGLRAGAAVLASGALAAAAALALSGATASASTAASGHSGWVTSWAASPMAATPASLVTAPNDFSAAGFTDQTVRNIVWTSVGGQAARIRLSNQFGTQPVTFTQVDVGLSAGGAVIVTGTNHPVTFGGSTSVTIAPGTAVASDPVAMFVPAAMDLAVSMYAQAATGSATYHSDAQQVNYVAAGNAAGSELGSAFTTQTYAWYFLDGVDVQPVTQVGGTVVAFGDSITDGYQSTVNLNLRWPNDLARRFVALPPAKDHAVVDEGISGNRVLSDSACLGQNGEARFLRDTAQSGARYVIFLEGINDIGFSQVPNSGCFAPNTDESAAQIIAGYRKVIADAHAAGLKIFGGTLTPFAGSFYYSAAGEAERAAVNSWIRTSGAFDAVIDFDKAVQDPANPLQLNPGYDSGDHLHPNDAGYLAMSNAINLALFQS
jgi:lysophospholipase L1-like esterase